MKPSIVYILLCVVQFCVSYRFIVDPGPTVIATRGEIWPKPQKQTKSSVYMNIDPNSFIFSVSGFNCTILQKAILRYEQIMLLMAPWHRNVKHPLSENENFNNANSKISNENILNSLRIQLNKECEYLPSMNMDEKYELNIKLDSNEGQAVLKSNSIWGVLRGLESFMQLIYLNHDENKLLVNVTNIVDFPRFSHRGLLLDTSRHFQPMDIIYKMLDAMACNKMNVFHWHIVDDQSFPYESTTYPLLSKKGAFHPNFVYSQQNVKDVIEYARLLGIRVIPEFDTPGHTRSWGEGYLELLTPCYRNTQPTGKYGPLNPTRETTYTFMNKFMKEIISTFPDPYLHLGGDEVEYDCWASNPEINNYMNQNNITLYEKLEEIYIQRLINMVASLNASSVVWEEVFTSGIKLPPETVVQVWISAFTLSNVTAAGYPALLSSCWYLDHIANGGDWNKYYYCDPFNFVNSAREESLILGGEACMWAESVDATNVLQRVWPRASAVAERLWSSQFVVDIQDAARRLEEHTCRMNLRKIPAQPPNRSGFCV